MLTGCQKANKENNVFKDALGVKGLGFKHHGNHPGNHGSHYGNHHGNYHDNHSNHHGKKELYLVALAHPNASLDGVGVALKVKVRQSNDDLTW